MFSFKAVARKASRVVNIYGHNHRGDDGTLTSLQLIVSDCRRLGLNNNYISSGCKTMTDLSLFYFIIHVAIKSVLQLLQSAFYRITVQCCETAIIKLSATIV